MKFGIYRLSPILGHHRCLVDYNSRVTSCPGGLSGDVKAHYWTIQNIFEKFGDYKGFREKNIFFIFSRVNFLI
jgi:hypothetical protein